ncbi:acyl-CoA dehydrogenase family protein [Streptomyces niveiscabiei]|uniref:Acyl-CoA dehydrogenase family protein n=1 Tax=Streptomyces niveiscabiei TaxID=164115 RepID=A0ABW9HJS2_9ACTN
MNSSPLLAVLAGAPIVDAAPGPRPRPPREVPEILEFLDGRVDPETVDTTRALPPGLLDGLKKRGFLRLCAEPRLGGRGLTAHGTFTVLEAVARRSVAVALTLGISNGVGAAALLPALEPGPLRAFLEERVRNGTVSGFALTEPAGQNNAWPSATATPMPDGTAYLLRGEKLFTGCGPVADLLAVAATTPSPDGRRRVCVCFVDTAAPGFAVRSRHEFTGARGLPNAALRLDGVLVPADRVFLGAEDIPGVPAAFASCALLGQLLFTGAPALAVVRHCLDWSRSFTARRRIDGRPLGDYPEIRTLVARTAADLYTVESVVHWALRDTPAGRTPALDTLLAKNICVRAAARAVERTLSLFGAEGLETVASKRLRGAPDIPLERAWRDARMLRTAGNVGVRLDQTAGRMLVGAGLDGRPAVAGHTRPTPGHHPGHLRAATRLAARLRTRLSQAAPDHVLTGHGRLAGDLLVLCATLTAAHDTTTHRLAALACAGARHRAATTWRELTDPDRSAYEELGRDLLGPRPAYGT